MCVIWYLAELSVFQEMGLETLISIQAEYFINPCIWFQSCRCIFPIHNDNVHIISHHVSNGAKLSSQKAWAVCNAHLGM